jgi:hypothetical protein
MNHLLSLNTVLINDVLFKFFSRCDDCTKHELSRVCKLFKQIFDNDALWKERAIHCGKTDEEMSNKEFVQLYHYNYINFFFCKFPQIKKSTTRRRIKGKDVFFAKTQIDEVIQKTKKFLKVKTSDLLFPMTLQMLIEAEMINPKDSSHLYTVCSHPNEYIEQNLTLLIRAGATPDRTSLNVLMMKKVPQQAIQLMLRTGMQLPEITFVQYFINYRSQLTLETVQAFLANDVPVGILTLLNARLSKVSEEIMDVLNKAYAKQ